MIKIKKYTTDKVRGLYVIYNNTTGVSNVNYIFYEVVIIT